MSNSKIKAVEDFRNLSRGFKAVIALADELEAVGNLQQASDELTAGIANAQKERDKLIEANKVLAINAESSANATLAKASDEAAALLARAKKDAEDVLSRADAKAASIVQGAEADLAVTNGLLDKAKAAVKSAEAKHSKLESEVTALEARLEKAQAQTRKLLEG
jgi:cell division septum initiation protein DivIVA